MASLASLLYPESPCRIAAAALVGPRTLRLRLQSERGEFPPWKPGQYARLSFSGDFLPSSSRAFALSSGPHERSAVEVCVKALDAWSLRLVERFEASGFGPDDEAFLGRPYGRFCLEPRETGPGEGPLVLLAGGSGVSPFLAFLEHLAWADETRPTLLLWWAKTRDELGAARDFGVYARTFPGFRYASILTHDPLWTGERGRPDASQLARLLPAAKGADRADWDWTAKTGAAFGASYWISGPPGFREACARALARLGTPRNRVFSNRTM